MLLDIAIDLEIFEDEPLEYVRRDLEGLDTDTRRRAASDLVRGLLEHFTKEVTEIFSQYVNAYLQVRIIYHVTRTWYLFRWLFLILVASTDVVELRKRQNQ